MQGMFQKNQQSFSASERMTGVSESKLSKIMLQIGRVSLFSELQNFFIILLQNFFIILLYHFQQSNTQTQWGSDGPDSLIEEAGSDANGEGAEGVRKWSFW